MSIEKTLIHLQNNYDIYYNIDVLYFVNLDIFIKQRNRPIYIILKTKQFLSKGNLYIENNPESLPIGRFYTLYCSGLTVGHIFELPRKSLVVYPNYFSIEHPNVKKYKNVSMMIQNKNINVFSSGDSMLVVNNKRFLDIKTI